MIQAYACRCPLCDREAQAVELAGLGMKRVECPYCTTYEISDRVERFLKEKPEAKARARFVSEAVRRATEGVEPTEAAVRCMKLRTEWYFLESAAREESRQQPE
jgi:hypothetical protein